MKTDKSYWILTAAFLLLGAGMFVLPSVDRQKEIPPDELFRAWLDTSRYISPDEVTRRIIGEDPSLLLIDVRSPDRFQEFSLPGALNIPLGELLSSDYEDYLYAESMDRVFFSNSDIQSEQAWIIGKRLGLENIYIMDGGLNRWADLILTPEPPQETSPAEVLALYRFRLGAKMFFTGGTETSSPAVSAVPVPVMRREKTGKIQGGC